MSPGRARIQLAMKKIAIHQQLFIARSEHTAPTSILSGQPWDKKTAITTRALL